MLSVQAQRFRSFRYTKRANELISNHSITLLTPYPNWTTIMFENPSFSPAPSSDALELTVKRTVLTPLSCIISTIPCAKVCAWVLNRTLDRSHPLKGTIACGFHYVWQLKILLLVAQAFYVCFSSIVLSHAMTII